MWKRVFNVQIVITVLTAAASTTAAMTATATLQWTLAEATSRTDPSGRTDLYR
jgi:hypothetical protein